MGRMKRIYDSESNVHFITTNTYYRVKVFDQPENAKLALQALKFIQDKNWINLSEYVILPDHLHLLFEIISNKNVSQIMHSFKSYIAQEIFKRRLIQDSQGRDALAMGKSINGASRPRRFMARIWQPSFYDHIIRDERDLEMHVNYIHFNPVKHEYVSRPEDWPWSSYHKHKRFGVIE